MPSMKRIDGFASGEKPDEGWVIIRVKVRPAIAAALKNEALRESQALHRSVYVSDLVRDALRLLLEARRVHPSQTQYRRRRFIPSPDSQGVKKNEK
jgi:hypothetical protein